MKKSKIQENFDQIPSGKLSAKSVKDIIILRGLGDSIRDFLMPKNILDPKLAKLVKDAKTALRKVQDYVYD